MSRANNDNVNDSFPLENNNVNDNVGPRCDCDRKFDVDNIANDLVRRLNNPSAINYYRKIAWRLPPSVIYDNLERAQHGKSPVRLFTWLCQASLKRTA